ncbi:biopolymer transport protein ExbD [Gimesia alba]|uniref:Biopolymer transport protein ExbD n=1 Tax=Gimesia alba TaxID=2527973 RepID=A0A517RH47_9PLAN|nr:biopolymer transporter ExbD [Gimesia alba]QDT43185.1 biopolymer transport protein ExbD [Gimesia alba]
MPIKFYCNQCGQRLSISSKKAGKTVSCPACHKQITIPLKSQARRSEQTENRAAPPTEADLSPQINTPLDQDQNQLLDDLDDLGPLGESWDELLDDDWEVAAAEEASQPVVAEAQEDQIDEPEVEKTAPTEKQQPTAEVTSPPKEQSTPPEPVSPVTETKPKVEKTKAAVSTVAATSTVTSMQFEEDDEDEDDEDEGFSIRSAESDFEEMDLTPMVDVTFLLLIFFMITASFSLQKSIQVPPPNPDEDGVSQSLQTLDDFREESIIVEIDNNNGIYVDDTKLANPSEIVQAILDRRDQAGKPKRELVLSAHKAARHETVVAVVDAANEVGMQKIRLATYRGPED